MFWLSNKNNYNMLKNSTSFFKKLIRLQEIRINERPYIEFFSVLLIKNSECQYEKEIALA